MGTEVRFRIRRGGPATRDALLIVNKPHEREWHEDTEERILTNRGTRYTVT
jgi:hypothetical protein